MRHLGKGLVLFFVLLFFSCASIDQEQIRHDFDLGLYTRCLKTLENEAKEHPKDAHLLSLDKGIVYMALERPKDALKEFRYARDKLDELKGLGFFESFKSLFLDDRELDYEGHDYEHVLVRALLALADLAAKAGDAEAYALQVLERQLEIIQAYKDEKGRMPKKAYKLVAFGCYLRGIMAEEDPLRIDVAEKEYKKVLEIEPNFAFGKENLERVKERRYPPKGYGVLHIIVLCGRGPFLVEGYADPKDQAWANAMAIAQAVWQFHRKRVVFPMISSIKIPVLAFYRENPTEAHVFVDGQKAGITATVTDVEETAEKEFKAMRADIIARAIVRRAFKITLTEAVKGAARKGTKKRENKDLIDFLGGIAGWLWIESERADTRCWDLLPATFQVLRLELKEGEHEVFIYPGYGGRKCGSPQKVKVNIKDGLNSYVISILPTLKGGPKPLVSEPGF